MSFFLEAPTGFEPVIEVLQTFALPLGYGAKILNDSDGNRTRVTAVKGRCLNRLTTEPYVTLFRGFSLFSFPCLLLAGSKLPE